MREAGPEFFELGETVTFTFFDADETLTLPVSLARARPAVDVYAVLDATFTNRALVRAVRTALPDLFAAVDAVSAHAAFGAAIFRDESELWNGFANLQSLTAEKRAVHEALENTTGAGGLDYFESNLVALYLAATNTSVGWRRNARKVIVMAASFVGHEPTCTGRLPKLNRSVVAHTLVEERIVPVFYSRPGDGLDAATVPYGCSGSSTAGVGQGSHIARVAGGAIVEGDAKVFDTNLVLDAIKARLLRVNIDTSDCDAIFDIKTNASDHAVVPLGGGLQLKLKMTRKLCKESSDGIKRGKCKIGIDIDGMRTESLTVIVDRYQKCPTNNTYDPIERSRNQN